jgi:hypothetical protein
VRADGAAWARPEGPCQIVSLFPYLEFYICAAPQNWHGPLFVGYLLWAVLLFVVLATTADDYFAPSLTRLSEWLAQPAAAARRSGS